MMRSRFRLLPRLALNTTGHSGDRHRHCAAVARSCAHPIALLAVLAILVASAGSAAAREAAAKTEPILRLAQVTPGPPTRQPGASPLPPKPRRIVCIGGRVSGQRCLCPSSSAVATAPSVYVCRIPPRNPGASSGAGAVSCRGGRVVSGRCLCPSNTIWRAGACRESGTREPQRSENPSGREREPRQVEPRDVGPARRPPAQSALPPPSGPARIAPGPAPRPDALAISAVDTTVTAEIVATLRAATPQAVEDDIARDFNLVLLERLEVILTEERLVRFRIPDARTVDAVVAALGGDARLAGPQPNFVYRNQGGGSATPVDLQYAARILELPAAHLIANGNGVLVAVIDSGVDHRHPDLAGAVGEEIDVTGAVTGTNAGAVQVTDPHGTAIAGIIAARGLVRGVAPLARVLSVKAFRPTASGMASVSTTAMLVAGIDKAVGKGALVLNMSFAGAEDRIVHRLIKAAAARGVHIVAAAGNKGPGAPPAFPAAYAEVMAVTATDASDRLYEKANRGGYVVVAAPGVDVLAPGAARSHQLQSGTSFAAAHVSGALALLIELVPGISPTAAREALVSGAVDLGQPGPDDEFGAGRISAAAALRQIVKTP